MAKVAGRSRVGEAIAIDIGADAVVIESGAGEERLPRAERPVVTVEVSAPRMRLRPGLRIPRGANGARVVWFDQPHERERAVQALVRSGWTVRPRRWPWVVGLVAFVLAGVLVFRLSWLLAVFLLLVAGGCLLHLVRNERGARLSTG